MKRIYFIGGLFCFLGLLCDVSAAEPSPTRDAAFLPVSVTNLSTGRFTVFCLTNSTKAHFVCIPQAIEWADTNGWKAVSLSGKAGGQMRKWIGVPEELMSGQAATFMVPAPVTNVAWRLVFRYQEQKSLVDPVKDAVRHLTDAEAAKYQDRQFSGRLYFLRTPEVKP